MRHILNPSSNTYKKMNNPKNYLPTLIVNIAIHQNKPKKYLIINVIEIKVINQINLVKINLNKIKKKMYLPKEAHLLIGNFYKDHNKIKLVLNKELNLLLLRIQELKN